MNTNQQARVYWENIFQGNSIDLNSESLVKSLQNLFSKQLQRVSSDFPNFHYIIDDVSTINQFVDSIPAHLHSINILIRPLKENSYSCIITDEEIELLAKNEHLHWVNQMYNAGWRYDDAINFKFKTHPDIVHFSALSRERIRFYRELMYTVPVILRNSGYELFKPADYIFIREDLIESLAGAIHERYRFMIREMNEKSRAESVYEKLGIVNVYNRQYCACAFEQLPDDIKSSNRDSAYHIATKLLSIGYTIINEFEKEVPCLLVLSETDVETMAKLEHERWTWEKRLKGFTYGVVRNDALRKHPCLVPYIELPELEKEKDRVQVRFYPSLLHDINYSVKALDPEQLQKISYIPLQGVFLQKSEKRIENVVRMISEEGLIGSEDIMQAININLLDAKRSIRSSVEALYAASQIQRCILPSKLFFRTCLSNSFILFKPKDVLSGDFYFVSKVHNFIILAVADCTGHGPSGAMLSMICSSFLDQAVNDHRLTDPSMIIGYVYEKLISFMKRHDTTVISDYGMEISICNINTETRTVYYAGVNRALYLFRNGALEIIDPQKVKVGDSYRSIAKFVKTSQQLNLSVGDTFYMLTDGYADQIGGRENKKFMTNNFVKKLKEIQPKTMLEQFEILNCSIEEWKTSASEGHNEQTDDILVIGVRL